MSTTLIAKRRCTEERATRQRKVVTCPQDNGINKAGRTNLLVPRLVLLLCVVPDFAGIDFTSLLHLLRFSDRSGKSALGSSTSHSEPVEWIGKIKRVFGITDAASSVLFMNTQPKL